MFETSNDSSYRKPCSLARELPVSGRKLLLVLSVFVLLAGCASQREIINESVFKRVGLPENTDAFRNRWYAGAAIGSSRFDPDLSDVSFTVQQGSAVGTQFRIGYDLHSLFSLEVDSSVLGGAELESTAEVEYTSFALSGLVYALAGKANRSRRQKWSAFGRFGFGLSSASSNVAPLDGRDLSGLVLGLGVEYGLANGVGLRFEASRLHDEAVFAGLGAVYRFGGPGKRGILPRLAQKTSDTADRPTSSGSYYSSNSPAGNQDILPEPGLQAGLPGVFQQDAHPSHQADVTPRVPSGQQNQFIGKVVVATVHDLDGDGVSNAADECANTPTGTSVNSEGCGLFDGVVEGVSFESGSAGLDHSTKHILDRLAVRLLAFPEIRVEVQAHTDDKGPESINKSVSQTRAAAVVRYLQASGVDSKQLEAVGMGEIRPRSDNDSELGRLSNRRIELKTLPDLNIVPRHVTVVSPTMEVIQLNSSAASVERLLNSRKKQTGAAADSIAGSVANKRTGAESATPVLGAAMAAPIEALPALIELPGTRFNGILDNVGFIERTAKFTDGSTAELDVIARQLKEHNKARIAIMAHTDDGGDDSANMKLTKEQARAVATYLTQQGVAGNRLVSEGYGSDLPLAQNVTESDRALNRRIELRLLAR